MRLTTHLALASCPKANICSTVPLARRPLASASALAGSQTAAAPVLA